MDPEDYAEFPSFDSDALLRKYPALRDDTDLDRGNKGITIVALANIPRAMSKTQADPGPVRPASSGAPSADRRQRTSASSVAVPPFSAR